MFSWTNDLFIYAFCSTWSVKPQFFVLFRLLHFAISIGTWEVSSLFRIVGFKTEPLTKEPLISPFNFLTGNIHSVAKCSDGKKGRKTNKKPIITTQPQRRHVVLHREKPNSLDLFVHSNGEEQAPPSSSVRKLRLPSVETSLPWGICGLIRPNLANCKAGQKGASRFVPTEMAMQQIQ